MAKTTVPSSAVLMKMSAQGFQSAALVASCTPTTITLPARQLAEPMIGRIKPPASGRLQIADTKVVALRLRISSSGVRSWSVLYRPRGYRGSIQRLTLGRWPQMGVAAARQAAREAIATAGKGEDPAAEKRATKAAPEPAIDTFGAVAAEWLRRYAAPRQPRSLQQTEKLIGRYLLPAWGERPVGSITKHDVLKLVDKLQDRSHLRTANRVLGLARQIFSWAAERDLIDVSPAAAVPRPSPNKSRSHVIEDADLARIWRAAERLAWPWDSYIRLLILTGQRRTEVATLRWVDVDLERALWRLPAELTKSNRAHDVPLSEPAVEILRAMPEIVGNGFVFATTGSGPITNYSRVKVRLDKLAGVTGWCLHDLRRTAATGMAKLGVLPHVLAAILNHAPASTQGITSVYNRFQYSAEKRAALALWSGHVLDLAAGRSSNVVAA